MKRRDFLFVVGSTAVAWPLAVRAQQDGGIRRVALVHVLGKDDKRAQDAFIEFKAGMEKLGWIEEKNIHYKSYWGGKSGGRFTELAKEVVRKTPNVIYIVGTPLTVALHRETKGLPRRMPMAIPAANARNDSTVMTGTGARS